MNNLLKRSIWPIDEILKVTTTLGQCGPGRNVNEVVVHTLQISKTEADAVSYLSTGVIVSIF